MEKAAGGETVVAVVIVGILKFRMQDKKYFVSNCLRQSTKTFLKHFILFVSGHLAVSCLFCFKIAKLKI